MWFKTQNKQNNLLFLKTYKLTMELCTRMNPSWPEMALSQLYIPPGYNITHTYYITVRAKRETHTHKIQRMRAHTNAFKPNTGRKMSHGQREEISWFIFIGLIIWQFQVGMTLLSYNLYYDRCSGSTQLSYQRGRGSTGVNRKFSQ